MIANLMIAEFLVQPESTAVLLGTDLVLYCVAHASDWDVLEYTWRFQDVDVATSLPRALMSGNHSIFVPRLTQSDLGAYQCLVTNPDQSVVMSRTAMVVQACKYSFCHLVKTLLIYRVCDTMRGSKFTVAAVANLL